MSNHLPECPQFCDGKPPKCRGGDCTLCDEVDCICDLLRACERRVLEEEQSHLPAVLFGNGDEKAVLQIRDMAYAAGVQAARDVVAAFEPLLDISKHKGGYDCCGCSTTYELHEDALAAIDLLRGES